MITTYFLIAFFLGGWLFGADSVDPLKRWGFWERLAIVALCIVWPFLLFLMWSEWRKP